MSALMLSGLGVVAAGICVIAYGLMTAAREVRDGGPVPPGARRVQLAGMALAVCGFGLMMLSIGMISTDIVGGVLLLQGAAMVVFSRRLERFLR